MADPLIRNDAADEADAEPGALSAWLPRVLIGLVLAAFVAGVVIGARSLLSTPDAPRRQVAKISILPDTPPPPPPPPKEEPKKEQKEEQRENTPREQPKVEQTPAPAEAPIKMEGAAGDGPSAFAAGSVANEYSSGAPVVGPGTTGGGTGSDRAQERFYANSARQLLRDSIEKNLNPDAGELTATFAIWVDDEGGIRRFELEGSGDKSRDGDMRQALNDTSKSLRLPPPGNLTQPLRFRLTVRPAG